MPNVDVSPETELHAAHAHGHDLERNNDDNEKSNHHKKVWVLGVARVQKQVSVETILYYTLCSFLLMAHGLFYTIKRLSQLRFELDSRSIRARFDSRTLSQLRFDSIRARFDTIRARFEHWRKNEHV